MILLTDWIILILNPKPYSSLWLGLRIRGLEVEVCECWAGHRHTRRIRAADVVTSTDMLSLLIHCTKETTLRLLSSSFLWFIFRIL